MDDGQNKSRFPTDLAKPAEPARAYFPDRHLAAFAASILAHAAVFGAMLYFAPSMMKPHSDWVLAYLVERGDGASQRSGADNLGAKAAATIPATGPIAIVNSTAPRTSHKIDRNRNRKRMTATSSVEVASIEPIVSPHDAPRAPAPITFHPVQRGQSSPTGASQAGLQSPSLYGSAAGLDPNRPGSGDGASASDAGGTIEGGESIAHADYSKNPPPVYPTSARRRAQQGTVTIRVLVGADGSVIRAEIAESSGFDALDDAALQSVRSRWKFIAARRAGVTFESWVLVPIRFALTEANASSLTEK